MKRRILIPTDPYLPCAGCDREGQKRRDILDIPLCDVCHIKEYERVLNSLELRKSPKQENTESIRPENDEFFCGPATESTRKEGPSKAKSEAERACERYGHKIKFDALRDTTTYGLFSLESVTVSGRCEICDLWVFESVRLQRDT